MDKGGDKTAKGHSVAKKEQQLPLNERFAMGVGLDLQSIFQGRKEAVKHIDEGAADNPNPYNQNKKSQKRLTKNSKKVIETVGKLGVKEAITQSGGSHHIDIDSHNEGERMSDGMSEEGKLKMAKMHAKMAKKIAKHLIGAKELTLIGDKAYVNMAFPGSHEETIDKVRRAVRGTGSESGGLDSDGYTDVLATHPDKVVYSKSSYQIGGDQKVSHWERPYKLGDGGTVELGDAKQLEPGMLEVSKKELDAVGCKSLKDWEFQVWANAYSSKELVDQAMLLWATEAAGKLTMGECAKLTAEARKKIPDSKFAYVDKNGVGHFPIHDAAHVRNALARLGQSPYGSKARAKVEAAAKKMGIGEPAKKGNKAVTEVASAAARLDAAGAIGTGSTVDAISRMAQTVAGTGRPIMFFKDKAGQQRFFLVGTNNYSDREDELFTAAAHKEFIQWSDTNRSYPELWLWHAKGSRFGQVDWLDFVTVEEGTGTKEKVNTGVMVCASGAIDNTKAARQLVSRIKEYDGAVSHGFVGVRNKEGHWTKYRSWEFSWLPVEAAANYGTAFNLLEGAKEMGFNPAKRAALLELVGSEATVKAWESQTDQMNKDLEALGISSKELRKMMDNPESSEKAKKAAPPAADASDDEDDDDDDDKSGGSKEFQVGFKAIADQLTTLTTATKELTEATQLALETSQKALKRSKKALDLQSTSLDQAVAAAMAPRGTGLHSVKSGAKEKLNNGGTLSNDEVEATGQPSATAAFQRTVAGNLSGVSAGIKGLEDTLEDPVALEMAAARNGNGNHN